MDRYSAVLMRDVRIAWRSKGEWLQSMLFFVIFATLTGIALGGNNEALTKFAPSLIWLALLFALLLSFDRLFKADHLDGSLEQLHLTEIPTSSYVTSKSVSHWIIIVLPLLVVLPIVSLLMGLSFPAFAGLFYAILCASPALIVIGAFCSACLVGSRNNSLLIILLAVPLFIPMIIFGTSAVTSYTNYGLNAVEFKALVGLSLISTAIGIPATAAALDATHE